MNEQEPVGLDIRHAKELEMNNVYGAHGHLVESALLVNIAERPADRVDQLFDGSLGVHGREVERIVERHVSARRHVHHSSSTGNALLVMLNQIVVSYFK